MQTRTLPTIAAALIISAAGAMAPTVPVASAAPTANLTIRVECGGAKGTGGGPMIWARDGSPDYSTANIRVSHNVVFHVSLNGGPNRDIPAGRPIGVGGGTEVFEITPNAFSGSVAVRATTSTPQGRFAKLRGTWQVNCPGNQPTRPPSGSAG